MCKFEEGTASIVFYNKIFRKPVINSFNTAHGGLSGLVVAIFKGTCSAIYRIGFRSSTCRAMRWDVGLLRKTHPTMVEGVAEGGT